MSFSAFRKLTEGLTSTCVSVSLAMMQSCLLMPLQAAISHMGLCSSGVQRNAIVLLHLRALFSRGILLAPCPLPRRARLPSRPASWGTGARSGGRCPPPRGPCARRWPARRSPSRLAGSRVCGACHVCGCASRRRHAPALHLVGQEVLGHGEQALVGGNNPSIFTVTA